MHKPNSQSVYRSGLNISKHHKIRSASNAPFINTIKSIQQKKMYILDKKRQQTDKYIKELEELGRTQNHLKSTIKSSLGKIGNPDKQNKTLIQQNLLNKLLPPPKRERLQTKQFGKNAEQSLFGGNGKKFQQKKPDVETLIQSNITLKKQIQQLNKNLLNTRIREKELEKKLKKLEEKKTQNVDEIINELQNDRNVNVLVDILRKKMHEIQVKLINAQEEIKRLRKLPNVSIYEENNVQKQHYMAETIRLKAILSSYELINSQAENSNYQPNCYQKDSQNSIPYSSPYQTTGANTPLYSPQKNKKQSSLSQQFLQMLKQQNQKLKSTIRLLQNQKVLIKSHNKIYKDNINRTAKQLQTLKQKLLYKDSQIQKLISENKNLLFKKATQLKIQQQTVENKQIKQLQRELEILENRCKKLQEENQLLVEDNIVIKEKQKSKSIELIEKENKYETMRIEMAEMESRYEQRIRSLQIGKLQQAQSHTNIRRFSKVYNRNPSSSIKLSVLQIKIRNSDREVKFKDIKLPLLKLYHLKKQGIISQYQDIFKLYTVSRKRQDSCVIYRQSKFGNQEINQGRGQNTDSQEQTTNIITFSHMLRVFQSSPLDLTNSDSDKLARYIYNDFGEVDQTQENANGLFSYNSIHRSNFKEQKVLDKNLIINILTAAVNKLIECLSDQPCLNAWKCLLNKNKRFLAALQRLENETDKLLLEKKRLDLQNIHQISKQFLTVDEFISLLSQHQRTEISEEQINFMCIQGFSFEKSIKQIILERQKIISALYSLIQGNYNTQISMCQPYFPSNRQTEKQFTLEQNQNGLLDELSLENEAQAGEIKIKNNLNPLQGFEASQSRIDNTEIIGSQTFPDALSENQVGLWQLDAENSLEEGSEKKLKEISKYIINIQQFEAQQAQMSNIEQHPASSFLEDSEFDNQDPDIDESPKTNQSAKSESSYESQQLIKNQQTSKPGLILQQIDSFEPKQYQNKLKEQKNSILSDHFERDESFQGEEYTDNENENDDGDGEDSQSSYLDSSQENQDQGQQSQEITENSQSFNQR